MKTSDITLFQHEEFGALRVLISSDGKPWFVARDVALALGYVKPEHAVAAHCKYAKSLASLKSGEANEFSGLPGNTLLIPESDLYRLIFGSKLQGAERFKDWLAEDVLPSLRQTGRYDMRDDSQPATLGDIRGIDNRLTHVETSLQAVASNQAQIATINSHTVQALGEIMQKLSIMPNIQDALENQRIHPKGFGKVTKSIFREGVGRLGGLCPCCGLVRIVDENMNALSILEYDHWNGASNSLNNGWPVCRECNQRRLKDWNYRQSVQHRFRTFQDTTKQIENERKVATVKKPRKNDFRGVYCLPGVENGHDS